MEKILNLYHLINCIIKCRNKYLSWSKFPSSGWRYRILPAHRHKTKQRRNIGHGGANESSYAVAKVWSPYDRFDHYKLLSDRDPSVVSFLQIISLAPKNFAALILARFTSPIQAPFFVKTVTKCLVRSYTLLWRQIELHSAT